VNADVEAAARARVGPISAVVCNYQGEQYLGACLDALRAVGDALDEIVVVDNGSTDGGPALVESRYPDVRLLRLGANRGPAAARNAGMRAARNRWVLAVDNDAEVAPGCVERLVAALEARPDAVAAQPRSLIAEDPTVVHYDGGSFHYAGLLSLRNFYRPVAEAEGAGIVDVDGFVSVCVLLDRDVVLGVGGYDEEFFILFEDYDLSLRLRLAGHTIVSVEDAVVLHRGGTAGISFRADAYPKRRAFFHSRNRWLVLVKNHRWRTLLVSAPGLLAYEIVWLAFATARGHLPAHLLGKAAFIRRLPSALARRREIQSRRRVRDRDLLVGGPLTFSPLLLVRPGARAVANALSRTLALWWRAVRPLAG
jgi:GT2 family glycosyltransferase